jgi:uncharacterized phage protein (TIGR02216 family)
MAVEPTPWPEMIVAAQRMGLAPAQFWRLSLKEWRVLVAPAGGPALTREAFSALARRYPDQAPS